jgi:hypothetical protein
MSPCFTDEKIESQKTNFPEVTELLSGITGIQVRIASGKQDSLFFLSNRMANIDYISQFPLHLGVAT